MEKITIKGFGPIKDAEIEVKKLLVLIGEQASGKSTIAKLIYFFKSLPFEFYKNHYEQDPNATNVEEDAREKLKKRFGELFGEASVKPEFTITYQFATSKTLTFFRKGQEKLEVLISPSILDGLTEAVKLDFAKKRQDLRTKIDSEQDPSNQFDLKWDLRDLIANLAHKIDIAFANIQRQNLFVIAGRESFVGFKDTVGDAVKNRQEKDQFRYGGRDFGSIDSMLMGDFIDYFKGVHERFRAWGRNGVSVIDSLEKNLKDNYKILADHSKSILKGSFAIDNDEENLLHENGFVHLINASSGQKEAVRIIQDIVYCFIAPRPIFRIIEEPEAHLFPVAQKQLIELLVFLANARTENQVIITTHSPYVLTTLNNLLFATRVVQKNPAAEEEVARVAPAPFRIDPATFAAYSLGNSFDTEEPYCANIVDMEMGMIDQNYLDTVSDLLGMEFDHLRNIHLRSFKANGNI
jgi:predicted ATP-dependent endonuclease of OLD family